MPQINKRNLILYLIVLDLAWGIAAWVYDLPDLMHYPLYIWPLRAICPLYPLLIAFIWWRHYNNKKQINIIYTWGVLGSAMYALGALIFYPVMMTVEGFSLVGVASIPWILFYGLQGWYFIRFPLVKISPLSMTIVIVALFAKNFIDWKFVTFGYLISALVPEKTISGLFGAMTIFLLVSALMAARSAIGFSKPPQQ